MSAFPMQKKAMTKHLELGWHKASTSVEKTQQTSIFEKQTVQVKQAIQLTVVKCIHSIYLMAKNEITNHKFHLLQNLIDRVGHNENLKNFGHGSSSSMYEFFVYIGDYLLQRHIEKAKVAGCWALLVDETIDITTL